MVSYKTEIRAGEAVQIGKYSTQIAAIYPKPRCERREILVDGSAGYPAASVGIVRAIYGERGKPSVSSPAIDSATQNQMMAAPTVVAAAVITEESASEVAGGESGYIVGEAQLLHGALEC